MGGNAIKGAVRLDRDDYFALEKEICGLLEWAGVPVYSIAAYTSKSSFGDMDLLVHIDYYHPELIVYGLAATEVVRNGSVTSMGIPCDQGLFQVDIIAVNNPLWAQVYFSYNDLGNLMGRIAHKMGFKYGHDGLRYVLRDPDNPSCIVKELLVSYDLEKVFDLMGYDFLQYWENDNLGKFETLEDIFKYVVDNPYFDPDIYLLQNRNHIARVRDKKRPTYTAFLKWLEDKPELKRMDWQEEGVKEAIRAEMLEEAFSLWPDFKKEYDETLTQLSRDKELKKWWNGNTVRAVTGLEGKELGQFMSHFRNSFNGLPETHFYHWVVGPAGEGYREGILKQSFERWKEKLND